MTIRLETIHGLDLKEKTFAPHPDFRNPKFNIRPEVMDSLACASSASKIPPIELYKHPEDGSNCVLSGEHRIWNAIDQEWDEIAAIWMDFDSLEEAQVYALTTDLDFSRAHLTEAEEIGIVERLSALGLSSQEILKRVGRGNDRWLAKVKKILEADPAVLQAVKDGKLSLESGTQIAEQVPASEQSGVVEYVAQAESTQGRTQARENAGLIRAKTKTLSSKKMLEAVWPIYEPVKNETADEYQKGMWDAFSLYFGWNNRKRDDVFNDLGEKYTEFCEKQNRTKKRK